jgi:hypothetical protein
MSLILDGTNGLSDVDGSASTPAIRGTDTNTGIFFPAADTIAFAEGGTEVARFDSAGDFGIGTSNPTEKLDVVANPSGEDGAIVVRTQFGASYFGGVGNYPAFGYKNGSVLTAALGYDTNNNALFTGPASSKQPAYLARAWVNFNGTGTPAIRASGNVSSIIDGGTGSFGINFTTALVDANYAAVAGLQHRAGVNATGMLSWENPYSTTQLYMYAYDAGGIAYDPAVVCVAILR